MTKPGPKCSVCNHPEVRRIELLRAGGASLDSLAEKFDLSRDSINRHWHNHVTPEAKATYLAGADTLDALRDKAAAESDSVLDYLKIVRTTLLSHMLACSEAGDSRGVALVAGTLVSALERLAKVTGQLSSITSQTNINVALVNSPEFMQLGADLLRGLAPMPAARTVVAQILRAREAGVDPVTLPPPRLPPLPVTIEANAIE